ncbi:complement factor H-related protein 4-like [Myotis lucifugus]|uniref:complement factor H-related protein 4-like n=1 Tax=Myotis lucifugus TaxID=59463 RepID=UPI000CCC273D|nr:complement factor H-related protein 4-like [Myotis lucifugus]
MNIQSLAVSAPLGTAPSFLLFSRTDTCAWVFPSCAVIWEVPTSQQSPETCLKSEAKIENGFIAQPGFTYLLNQKVKYKCKQDYVTEDGQTSGSITCLQNGWSAQPRCIKSCGVPVFENARARSDGTWFKVNDRLEYECQDGYKNRDGHTVGSIVCGDNGWSDTPTCQAMNCSTPPSYGSAILTSQKKNSYKSGEQVAYRCPEHYQMDGSNVVECRDGIWIGTPTCKEICLKSKANIENGFIAESESTYPLNKKTKYKCKQGYVTEDGQTSGSITCLQNGWSAQPRCIKLCDLPIFENATAIITGKPLLPNDTLDYQCLDGYENRDGNALGSMLCSEDGWLHLPTCFKSADKCGPPPAISNGDITSLLLEGYPPGSRVEYQCQAYYELRGPRYVTCSYAKWSEVPRCIDPCVISEEIMNEKNIQLKRKDDKRYYVKTGDIIEFMCKSGRKAVTSEESFQAMCREGAVEFPRCE